MERPDKQLNALYSWEAEWPTWNIRTIDLKGCKKVIRWACRKYKVPMPPVLINPKKRGISFSCDDPLVIVLNRSHMNVAICLHEAAHHIHTELMGDVHETHGPEFLAIFLWLMIRTRIIPKRAVLLTAKFHGLSWRPLSLLSPNRIRKTYRRVIRKKTSLGSV